MVASKSPIGRWVILVVGFAVGLANAVCAADPPPPAMPPPKPPYPNLPAKGAQATGLIFISHGWRDSPSTWANDLKTKIATQLGDNAAKWDIVAYDWSNIEQGGKQFGAATGFSFKLGDALKKADQARVNGMSIGTFIGQKIHDAGYDNVHFYSHSAGSWLNDRAADRMKSKGSTATIQQTFFDTFLPLKDVNDDLGDTAKFALQYVDNREYSKDKPFTDATLKNAYNLEITKLDPSQERGFTNGAHSWPHEWYRQTAADPTVDIAHTWGYNRSLENSNMPNFGDVIQTRTVKKAMRDALPPPEAAKPAKQAPVVPKPKLDFRGGIKSDSGASIDVFDGTNFTLDADLFDPMEPEAWVAAEFDLLEPANILHFNYLFETLSLGQGWFTMYLDDELLYHSDERYARTPDLESEYLLVGNLQPGLHSLGFRLDPYSDDPFFGMTSTISVSDVWFTFAPELVPEPSTFALLAVGLLGMVAMRHRR